ncbi:MAG: hypothetical protein R3B39_00235 [Candidatus Paceibacterota bacterium]
MSASASGSWVGQPFHCREEVSGQARPAHANEATGILAEVTSQHQASLVELWRDTH